MRDRNSLPDDAHKRLEEEKRAREEAERQKRDASAREGSKYHPLQEAHERAVRTMEATRQMERQGQAMTQELFQRQTTAIMRKDQSPQEMQDIQDAARRAQGWRTRGDMQFTPDGSSFLRSAAQRANREHADRDRARREAADRSAYEARRAEPAAPRRELSEAGRRALDRLAARGETQKTASRDRQTEGNGQNRGRSRDDDGSS